MAKPHGHDIVVIGASAGGIDALTRIVRQLPADLPAAVFVVLHVSAGSTSALPAILTRAGPLPALTGYLDDGAAGLLAVKRQGGVAVVQDPADAQCPGMPTAALATVEADHVTRLDDAARLIDSLVAFRCGRGLCARSRTPGGKLSHPRPGTQERLR